MKKGTRTSSFGVSRRESHDSSVFYNSRLYRDVAAREGGAEVENPVPAEILDTVICSDSRKMEIIPDSSVHLMVTSPPYNVSKEYDTDLTLEEYLQLLGEVFSETYRILVNGGRACVNVANVGRRPYIPYHKYIIDAMLGAGFLMRGEILWDKGACLSGNTKVYVRDQRTGRACPRRMSDLASYGTWRLHDVESVDVGGTPRWTPIENLCFAGERRGLVFTFSDGSSVMGTPEHRFLSLDGTLVQANQLMIGDRLRRSPRTPEIAGWVPKAFANPDFAWALGLFLAEGCFDEGYSIRYALHRKEAVWLGRLRQAWEPFGCNVRYSFTGNRLRVRVHGRLAPIIVSEFVSGRSSHDKLPVNQVFQAPTYWRQLFLQGWLDGDGHFEPSHRRWTGSITGANRRLIPALRSLSRSLGYRVQHSSGWVTLNGNDKRYGILRWKLYLEESGYRTAVSWNEVEIKEISERSARFYDLALSYEPHLFVLANGLISHNSAGSSTAWGSWQSASNPVLRDTHEYILVFSKGKFARIRKGKESSMTREEFLEFTKSVWRFPSESATRIGHPAPFPEELPHRCIQLYTFKGDAVLDPFAGVGTTCIAALSTGRHFVAFDRSPEYVEKARKRIEAWRSSGTRPPRHPPGSSPD